MSFFTDREGYPRVGRIVVTAVTALVVIPLLVWGGSVLLAPLFGQGEAFKNKEDAVNRVNAQERFESLHQEILNADRRLDVLKGAVKADPSYANKTNYTGAQTYCLSVVADYNAEARKYSARDFRSFDLPEEIDNYDPTTDCKPTK